MPSSNFPCLRNFVLRLHLNHVTALGAALLFSAGGLTANAQTTTSFMSSGSSASPAINIVNSCSTAITSPTITSACGSNTGFAYSTINVPTADAGTVTKVVVTLNGVTSSGNGEEGYPDSLSVFFTSFYLVGPGGQKFELLGCTGNSTDGDNSGTPTSGLNDYNITIEDGEPAAPDSSGNGWTGPKGTDYTVAPSSYWTNQNDCVFGSIPNNAVGLSLPQTDGSKTLNGTFTGGASNGNWTLYVDNYDTFFTESGADPISVDSWTLSLTYNETVSASTTTTVSSSTNPSNSGSSVTFTATVSSTSTVDVGTVTFTSNGNTISCAQGTSVAVSNGTAQCTTSYTQGLYDIGASYSGGTGFLSSSTNSDVSQLVEGLTSSGGTDTFCNTGSIPLGYETTSIYPSIIKVTGFPGQTVSNVEVKLLDVTGKVTGSHLLVSPDGHHNLDFLDNAFNESDSTTGAWMNFDDSAGAYPNTNGTTGPPENSSSSPASYVGSDEDSVETIFPGSGAHSIDSAVPQVPGTINYGYNNENPDETYGPVTETFGSNFNGATADGDWALYPYENFADNENIAGGWCVALTVNTGVQTTTTVTSSQNPQLTAQSVTLTATVTANGSPVTSGGTVTFLENGVAPPGTVNGNNVVTLNGSGKATFTTAPLPEGDNLYVVEYGGDSSDNASQTTFTQRANDSTTLYANGAAISHGPTCGATYCYCNGGAVSANSSYKGAFTPNPSIIDVTGLPGTIGSVSLGLNQYSSASTILYALESMVVSPTGADLDFFSNAGYGSGGGTASLGNYIFSDAADNVISSSVSTLSPGTYSPTSYAEGDPNWPEPAQPYTASSSGFYTLPSGITYATPRGSGTFSSQFENTNPDGIWALYMTEDDPAGVASAANGWCVNFTENRVTVSVDLSHQGDGSGTDFVQGETGARITSTVQTSNSTGPTGDPFGTNPLTVADTLNSTLTYTGFSGTGWSCSASGQTVSCTNDEAVAQGSAYPTLTLDVNVASGAPGSIGNSVSVSGAGITGNSGSDTITVDPTPSLAVTKSHSGNFTAGTTGAWTITVSNTATSGATSGTVTLADTLPSGYTLNSSTSTGGLWTCNGSGTVTCTATPGIAGGSSSTITLTVNVPTNSLTTVSNTALAWGGGDPVHANQGSAATSNTDTVTVDAPPAITSASSATFTTGSAGSFTVTASGYPAPTFSETGILPTGVTMSSNGTLSGTPAAGTGGTYPLTITASNGVGPNATQSFTLTVDQAPAITSAGSTTFTTGAAGSFTVTTSAYPSPALSETGALPSGVTFTNNGNGTATLAGTPAAGSAGIYPFNILASNGVTPGGTQNFTLTVAAGLPALVSPAPGSVLGTSNVTFTWTSSSGVTAYDLWVGTTGVGSDNVYVAGPITATSATAPKVPYGVATDTVYVRLWYLIKNAWHSIDYTYSATQPVAPVLSSPTPGLGTQLGTSNVTFTWTPGTGATLYDLWLGTTGVGSDNVYVSGHITTTSAIAPKVPYGVASDTVYVRLLWLVNGAWQSNDYTYSATQSVAPALTTPTPNVGTVLGASNVAFTWTAGTGPTLYDFWLGTKGVGSDNVYVSGYITTTSATAPKVPASGATIYARLWYLVDDTWHSIDYTYTEQ